MKEGWICPRCGKVNAPFIASCDCKPAVTNGALDNADGCNHEWMTASIGATTVGCYTQLVCRKCGKQKQILNACNNPVEIISTL